MCRGSGTHNCEHKGNWSREFEQRFGPEDIEGRPRLEQIWVEGQRDGPNPEESPPEEVAGPRDEDRQWVPPGWQAALGRHYLVSHYPLRLSDGGNNFGVPLPCRPQLRDNLQVIADQFGLGSRQGMIKGLPVLSELSDPSRMSDGGNKLKVPLPCRTRGSG